MKNSEMIACLDRRRESILARHAFRRWGACDPIIAALEAEAAPEADDAVAFWHDPNYEPDTALLPDVFRSGLESCSLVAGLNVQLYTYQDFSNAPSSVQVLDARVLMPLDTFERILRSGRCKIATLADLLRLKAVQRSKARLVWFVDGDTAWLREPAEAIRRLGRDAYGHVFSSMKASPSGPGGPVRQEKFWMKHYLVTPRDHLYVATPCRFPSSSPALAELADLMEETLVTATTTEPVPWNFFMDALKSVIVRRGMEDAILPWTAFSPIPAFTQTTSITSDKSAHYDLGAVLAEAVGVNAFWQSGKVCTNGTALERGSFERIKTGSAWASILLAQKKAIALRAAPTLQGPQAKRLRGKTRDPIASGSVAWPEVPWIMPQLTASSPTPFHQTELYAEYSLGRTIGKGRFGVVFEASRRGRGAIVAIKTVTADGPGEVVNPLEISLHHAVASPYVVKLFDYFYSPAFSAIVLEKMDMDVATALAPDRTPKVIATGDLSAALTITRCVAKGLAFMHGQRVIHRDLHGCNVFLRVTPAVGEPASTPNGPTQTAIASNFKIVVAKIGDFGMACAEMNLLEFGIPELLSARCAKALTPPELLFRTGTVWKEPPLQLVYAPTQASYTTKVDVWSLGALHVLVLIGRLQTSGEPADMAETIAQLCGKFPEGLVKRLKWSAPSSLCTPRIEIVYGWGYDVNDRWKRIIDPMVHRIFQLDPSYRASAADVVHLLEQQR